jgi:hypothetical protein
MAVPFDFGIAKVKLADCGFHHRFGGFAHRIRTDRDNRLFVESSQGRYLLIAEFYSIFKW